MIEYSSDMDNIYKNIDECNPNKKRKIFIILDDLIADMISNENLKPVVTDLFIRGRKLNITLAFITIVFCCSKRYQTKLDTLFCYENFKQKRT